MPTRAQRHPVLGKLTQPPQAVKLQLGYCKLTKLLDIVTTAAPERERMVQPYTMHNSSSCFPTHAHAQRTGRRSKWPARRCTTTAALSTNVHACCKSHDDLTFRHAFLHLFVRQNDCPVEVNLILSAHILTHDGVVLDSRPLPDLGVPADNGSVDIGIVLDLHSRVDLLR